MSADGCSGAFGAGFKRVAHTDKPMLVALAWCYATMFTGAMALYGTNGL